MKRINYLILTGILLFTSRIYCNSDTLWVNKHGYVLCLYSEIKTYSSDTKNGYFIEMYFVDSLSFNFLNDPITADNIIINAPKIYIPFNIILGVHGMPLKESLTNFISSGIWDSTQVEEYIWNGQDNFKIALDAQIQSFKMTTGLKLFVWEVDINLLESKNPNESENAKISYILFKQPSNNFELYMTLIFPKIIVGPDFRGLNR